MTRKPVPATGAAAAASTRAKAVAAPAKAASRNAKTAAAPGSAKKTTKSVPVKALAPKAAAKAGARAAAQPLAVKAAKTVARPAAKAPARTAVKAAAKALARPAAKAVAAKGPALAVKNAARAIVKAAKDRPAAGRTRAAQAAPAPQPARPVLVRDSFTMPEGEYAVLASVKQACLKAGFEIKKSELLRIGVALVGRLDTATLRQVLDSLPQLKTGRPPGQ
jgi:hypothetical protein